MTAGNIHGRRFWKRYINNSPFARTFRVYTKFIASERSACTYLRTCVKLRLAASLAAYAYLLTSVSHLLPTKDSYQEYSEKKVLREVHMILDSSSHIWRVV